MRAPPRNSQLWPFLYWVSGLAKLAVGAALLGGGMGLGSAIPWLVDRLSVGSAAPVVAPATDSDTQYRLRLGEPDATQ